MADISHGVNFMAQFRYISYLQPKQEFWKGIRTCLTVCAPRFCHHPGEYTS